MICEENDNLIFREKVPLTVLARPLSAVPLSEAIPNFVIYSPSSAELITPPPPLFPPVAHTYSSMSAKILELAMGGTSQSEGEDNDEATIVLM